MPARISFTRSSDWGAGFVAQVTISPDQALNGWTLAFDGAFDIVNIWGANVLRHDGLHWLLSSADWNGQVAAGGMVSFGFLASTFAPAPNPAAFTLAGPLPATPPPPPRPVLSVGDVTVAENAGFAVFTLKLSAAASEAISVDLATRDGTAKALADYRRLATTVTFAPGETEKQVRVALVDDRVAESAESFGLALSNLRGAADLSSNVATATIIDDDAPRVSVADAAVYEGAAGARKLIFTISLSKAAEQSVVLDFATADGTAIAGQDYVARSGKLFFQPGESTKILPVTVLGDSTVEPDETLFLRLSNPVRAVITDGEAVGTIRNDDLPRLSVADATVTEGNPGGHAITGVLSTRGNEIVDATGTPVRIAAVNWFGLETGTFAPHGLYARNWQDMMDEMAHLGFNSIRLPFSAQSILDGGMPTGIDPLLNPDLVGLTPLGIMDRIIDYAGQIGLRVILDHHRSTAGDGPNLNGLWYDGGYTEARWIGLWQDLAARYAGNPTVIGADLHNEPHNVAWNAWAAAAEKAGNAIHDVNPDWLIFVEGVGDYKGSYSWWGGNLMGVADRPVVLEEPGKLVYAPHDYPASVYPQPWFSAPDYPNNLPQVFDRNWGFIWREGTAPVLIGEMGSRLETATDRAWLGKLTGYLSGDLDGNGTKDTTALGPSFAWWSWNPDSGDTGGILGDDWRSVMTKKMDAIAAIMPEASTSAHQASFVITLDAPAPAPVTLAWRTVAQTAGVDDFVAASGTLTFAAGESRKTIEVAITPDDVVEANETFRLEVFGVRGATVLDGVGIGTITDDDSAQARALADWVL